MGGQKGFTFLEVLVVVVIIAILAGIVGPAVFKRIGQARQTAARQQLEIFALALENYRLDTGRYPTTDQGLMALWEKPALPPVPESWNGPYLLKPPPRDPWGNSYVYRYPGGQGSGRYDLLSLGADGQPGGEGEDRDVVYGTEQGGS